jgi:hypothetical protein
MLPKDIWQIPPAWIIITAMTTPEIPFQPDLTINHVEGAFALVVGIIYGDPLPYYRAPEITRLVKGHQLRQIAHLSIRTLDSESLENKLRQIQDGWNDERYGSFSAAIGSAGEKISFPIIGFDVKEIGDGKYTYHLYLKVNPAVFRLGQSGPPVIMKFFE